MSSTNSKKRNIKKTSDGHSKRSRKEKEKKDDEPSTSATEPLALGSESPDTNCSICLGKIQNKSFTDSCLHTFCFVCLQEWSKVKAVCPLCKQPFQSIIHSVKNADTYEQYHLRENDADAENGMRFRYRTTLTHERWLVRQDRESARQRLLLSRPSRHSTRLHHSRLRQASTSAFRKRIYTYGFRVNGTENNGRATRQRNISADFYRRNPACTHRLVPWLNRELNVLLHNNEDNVTFVLELILDLIKRFDIQSEEFTEHVRSFLSARTEHFVHEFYHFARSPYDMVAYDRYAVYNDNGGDIILNVDSSSSSDSDDIVMLPSPEREENTVNDHAYAFGSVAPRRDVEPPAPFLVHSMGTFTPLLSRVRDFLSQFNSESLVTLPGQSGWESPLPGPSAVFLPDTGGSPIHVGSVSPSSSPVEVHSSRQSDTESLNSSHASDIVIVGEEKPWVERSPIMLVSDDDDNDDDMHIVYSRTGTPHHSKSHSSSPREQPHVHNLASPEAGSSRTHIAGKSEKNCEETRSHRPKNKDKEPKDKHGKKKSSGDKRENSRKHRDKERKLRDFFLSSESESRSRSPEKVGRHHRSAASARYHSKGEEYKRKKHHLHSDRIEWAHHRKRSKSKKHKSHKKKHSRRHKSPSTDHIFDSDSDVFRRKHRKAKPIYTESDQSIETRGLKAHEKRSRESRVSTSSHQSSHTVHGARRRSKSWEFDERPRRPHRHNSIEIINEPSVNTERAIKEYDKLKWDPQPSYAISSDSEIECVPTPPRSTSDIDRHLFKKHHSGHKSSTSARQPSGSDYAPGDDDPDASANELATASNHCGQACTCAMARARRESEASHSDVELGSSSTSASHHRVTCHSHGKTHLSLHPSPVPIASSSSCRDKTERPIAQSRANCVEGKVHSSPKHSPCSTGEVTGEKVKSNNGLQNKLTATPSNCLKVGVSICDPKPDKRHHQTPLNEAPVQQKSICALSSLSNPDSTVIDPEVDASLKNPAMWQAISQGIFARLASQDLLQCGSSSEDGTPDSDRLAQVQKMLDVLSSPVDVLTLPDMDNASTSARDSQNKTDEGLKETEEASLVFFGGDAVPKSGNKLPSGGSQQLPPMEILSKICDDNEPTSDNLTAGPDSVAQLIPEKCQVVEDVPPASPLPHHRTGDEDSAVLLPSHLNDGEEDACETDDALADGTNVGGVSLSATTVAMGHLPCETLSTNGEDEQQVLDSTDYLSSPGVERDPPDTAESFSQCQDAKERDTHCDNSIMCQNDIEDPLIGASHCQSGIISSGRM